MNSYTTTAKATYSEPTKSQFWSSPYEQRQPYKKKGWYASRAKVLAGRKINPNPLFRQTFTPSMGEGIPASSKMADAITKKTMMEKTPIGVRDYAMGWKDPKTKGVFKGIGRGTLKVGKSAAKIGAGAIRGSYRASRGIYKTMSKMPGKPLGLALGVLAMMGIGIMRGALNESRNVVYDRYMQDMTYSRNMASQSRVGLASGTHRMLSRDGTQGLSNSLSATRHGR